MIYWGRVRFEDDSIGVRFAGYFIEQILVEKVCFGCAFIYGVTYVL